jgi:hypothetical protein
MSRAIEVAEAVYASIESQAARVGLSPTELLTQDYGAPNGRCTPDAGTSGTPTVRLIDRVADLIGSLDSGRTDLSARHDDVIAEGLEEEHRGGRP